MMSKTAFLVRDKDGTVIGRYLVTDRPSPPKEYGGEWIVREVSEDTLKNATVDWWDSLP